MCWLLTLFPFVCFVINNSIEANQIDFSLFQFQNRCISWEKKIKITQVQKRVRLGTNLARNSYILYIINHWMLLCLLHKWRAKHLLIYFHALKLRLIFIEDDFFYWVRCSSWWRFFGKDWNRRFQKTKWFPYIWFARCKLML